MNRQQRDLYEATLDSLTRHPEQWVRDRYTVTHTATNVYVWIANGLSGLSVGLDGRLLREEVLGGVTTPSVLFGGFIGWRKKLWNAAMAAPNPDEEAKASKLTAAIEVLAA